MGWVLWALVGPVGLSYAQGAGEETDEVGEGRTARTVARGGADVGEDARRPSGFVTRVAVAQDAPQAVADALEQSAGVSVQRTASYGQPAYVGVRGGTARQLTVTLNGVPLDVPEGLGVDVGSLSVAGLDALSVYRGAAGAVEGAGALTGAVALGVQPKLRPGRRLIGRLTLGSFGLWEGAVTGDAGDRASSVRVSASLRRARGDFSFTDAQGVASRRVNNDHWRAQGLVSGAWRHRLGRLDVTALVDGGEQGVAGPSEFQNLFSRARAADHRVVVASRWQAHNVWSGPSSALDLSASTGVQWRESMYTNDAATLGGEFDTEARQINATARFGALLYTRALSGNTARAQLGADRLSYTRRTRATQRPESVEATRHRLSAALSDEQSLLDGRLSVLAAARVEHIADPSRAWTPLLPALGLVIRPLPKKLLATHPDLLRLRANLARTWRAPAFDELYLEAESIRGTPTLAPERALAADLGATIQTEALTLEAVGFAHAIDELILFVPVSAYLTEAANTGAATARGLETSARWQPHPRLAMHAHYTFTDTRLAIAPRPALPNRPRHRAQAAVALSTKHVTLTPAATWRSAATLDLLGRLRNTPFLNLQARLAVRLPAALTLHLSADNLLDRRDVLDATQRPLPGRAWGIGVSLAR